MGTGIDAARLVVERVAARLGDRLDAAYLFGSRARGDWHQESDADLLIVTEDRESAQRALHDAVPDALRSSGVYVSALVLTPSEVARSDLATAIRSEGLRLVPGAVALAGGKMEAAVRERVESHMREAEEKLRGARHALAGGFCDDAVSRAYYAMFHSARALALPRHVEPKTHGGLIAMVHQHLVDPGILEHDQAARLSDAERLRLYGDYGAEAQVSRATAERVLSDSEAFLRRAREILGSEGWLPAPSSS